MKELIELPCGHNYHSSCILRMMLNKKEFCPICRSPFDQHYESRLENPEINGFRNFIQRIFGGFEIGGNNVNMNDVNDLARIFPNVPRQEIEAEILAAGNIEQAILNISEWAQ